MKTLYIVLLAVIAAGVASLVACSDAVSTGDEVKPLAHDADKVYGIVYEGGTKIPVKGAPVFVCKRESEEDDWIDIDNVSTDKYGYYEFDPLLYGWPSGWFGKVDCTNDLKTGETRFGFPLQGPVHADIHLY
ncbi:MAG TPA: hypothetical protein VM054_11570 [bacterium]|nr:hypothetical protein [bacterium]